jgi:hypothetical protein
MNTMFCLSLLTLIIGVIYFARQFSKHSLHSWQHYTCLTALLVLISVLFLIQSGNVQSLNIAGSSVQLVDQKLNKVEALTEQNKRVAIKIVELINNVSSGTVDSEGYHSQTAYQLETNLLSTAGCSDLEIKNIISTNAVWK